MWRLTLETEALWEQSEEASRYLAERFGAPDYDAIRNFEVQKLGAPVHELTDSIRKIAQANLDTAAVTAMSLGEWLGFGECPIKVAELLPGIVTVAASTTIDDAAVETLTGWGPARPGRSRFLLAHRFFDVCEIAPPGVLGRRDSATMAKIRYVPCRPSDTSAVP